MSFCVLDANKLGHYSLPTGNITSRF